MEGEELTYEGIGVYELLLAVCLHAQIVKEHSNKSFDSMVGAAKMAGVSIEDLRAKRSIDQVEAVMKRLKEVEAEWV